MKNILLTAIIVSSIVACKSSKVNTANAAKENTDSGSGRYLGVELYLRPRIAFEGLYPEKKPL